MQLYKTLTNRLKSEINFVDDDGKLKKWVVLNKAQNFDPDLLKLLLSDTVLKEKFFIKIDEALVFNLNLFVQFLEQKNHLNDSYTQYKNKVGLTIDGKYMNQRNEVALVWPFKDCVLEGGQSKEEDKREEIFFNEILAQDEITQLTEPKVLTNAKTYNKAGEQKFAGFTRDADINKKRGLPADTITDNLIIKGNNLLALHSLEKEFAGKVKLIYIDPPYNTGGDGFKYNDNFNHSTWLTFMKNRLEVAKELLRADGVIFVHCDDNEQAYLKVLMDEVFGRGNFIETITVVNNPRGRDYGGIANMHECLHIYSTSKEYCIFPLYDAEKKFPFEDMLGGFELRELRNRNTAFHIGNRKNLVYPFYVNPKPTLDNDLHEIAINKVDGWLEVMPKKSQGIQTVWRWGKEKSLSGLNKEIFGKKMNDGGFQITEKYRKKHRMARSVWWDKLVNSERGTVHLKKLFKSKVFSNPKPEETLHRVIEISTQLNDIILDFHLGSGTTVAAAHKFGRQYIGVEQMDYIETVAVERMKKVITGEQGGISKAVEWNGGGSFTYLELKKYNQTFIDQIEEAKDTKALLQIWKQMKVKSFLNYNVDIKKQDEHLEDFKALNLAEQKRHLCEILDKNQLYVNLSSLKDKDFACTEDEQLVTRDFYQLKGK